MKRLFLLLTLAFCLYSFGQDVYVNGYYRSNGTYVAPHYRTSPNKTVNDNYSTLGNYNPHTGKWGTLPRDDKSLYVSSTVPAYNPDFSYLDLPLYSKPLPEINTDPSKEVNEIVHVPDKSKEQIYYRGGKYFKNNNGSKNYVTRTLSR